MMSLMLLRGGGYYGVINNDTGKYDIYAPISFVLNGKKSGNMKMDYKLRNINNGKFTIYAITDDFTS